MANAKSNSKKEVKYNPKQIASFARVGEHIVETELDAQETVYEAYGAIFGLERKESIIIARAAFDAAWEKAYGAIKGSLSKVVSGPGSKRINEMSMRTAYNRHSDGSAVFKAALFYVDNIGGANGKKEQEKAKAFMHEVKVLPDSKGRKRDALVAMSRKLVSKAAGNGSKTPESEREAKKWEKQKTERLEQAKKLLQFAPMDVLMVIRDAAEKHIERLKKALDAKAKDNSKGTVHKLRRAA